MLNKMKAKKKEKPPIIVAANKDALIANQDKLMCGKPRGQFHDHYLCVQSDCGCVFKYQTPDNVPDTNLTCDHGNKMIVYTDKPNKKVVASKAKTKAKAKSKKASKTPKSQ